MAALGNYKGTQGLGQQTARTEGQRRGGGGGGGHVCVCVCRTPT